MYFSILSSISNHYVTEWCIYRATHSCRIRVASPMQAEARETIPKMLAELNLGRTEKCVRVNSVSSGLVDADLEVILQAEVLPPALMLPKVEDTEEIQWVSEEPHSSPMFKISEDIKGKIPTDNGLDKLGVDKCPFK